MCSDALRCIFFGTNIKFAATGIACDFHHTSASSCAATVVAAKFRSDFPSVCCTSIFLVYAALKVSIMAVVNVVGWALCNRSRRPQSTCQLLLWTIIPLTEFWRNVNLLAWPDIGGPNSVLPCCLCCCNCCCRRCCRRCCCCNCCGCCWPINRSEGRFV